MVVNCDYYNLLHSSKNATDSFFNYIHNYPDSNPNFTNVVISAALLHSVLESFITYEMYNDLVEKYQKNILSKDTYDEFEDIFDLNPDLIKNMNYCDPPL